MKIEKQIVDEIHQIAKEFSTTKQKPYIAVLQPRRSFKETPAQQLQSWKNRHVDLTSVAVSYHAIDGNPVDSARCYLMEKALEDDAKYALFVDEDTVIPYDGVAKMVEVSKQFPDAIISGIYYVKFGNVMMSVKDEEGRWVLPNVNPDAPLIRNVVSTGLGCALIPLHIIRKIKEIYESIPLFCIVPDKTWKDEDVVFIGEDAWFFNLTRKCGFETIGVPSVQCLHMELSTGKYAAHPDVVLENYVTNIPITEPLTMKDRARVSKEYIERICSIPFHGLEKEIKNLPIEYTEDTLNRVKKYLLNGVKVSQNYYEISTLCEILNTLNPKTVLEVGVEKGGSFNIWSEFSDKDATLIGIDTEITPEIIENNIMKNIPDTKNVKFIGGDSTKRETVEEVKKILGNREIDFLFIDGDHKYESIKLDFENYSPFVGTGGIIAFHDIDGSFNKEETNGVRKYWNEIKDKYKYKEIVNTEAEYNFGIGIIFK